MKLQGTLKAKKEGEEVSNHVTGDVLTPDLGATQNFYTSNPSGAGVAGIGAMESNIEV